MKSVIITLLIISYSTISLAKDFQERTDWGHFFTDQKVEGAIVIVDERSGSHWVCNKARAQKRYSPASTFKIPHTLFALDAGAVKDEFQIFPWDGKKRYMNPGTKTRQFVHQ
jgi:beta-lactamase class D